MPTAGSTSRRRNRGGGGRRGGGQQAPLTQQGPSVGRFGPAARREGRSQPDSPPREPRHAVHAGRAYPEELGWPYEAESPYEVLGGEADWRLDQFKKAFRKLQVGLHPRSLPVCCQQTLARSARGHFCEVAASSQADSHIPAMRCSQVEHHPDRGGDAVVSAKVNAAWDLIQDNSRRRQLDAHLAGGDDAFDGFGGGSFGSFGVSSFSESGFGDKFFSDQDFGGSFGHSPSTSGSSVTRSWVNGVEVTKPPPAASKQQSAATTRKAVEKAVRDCQAKHDRELRHHLQATAHAKEQADAISAKTARDCQAKHDRELASLRQQIQAITRAKDEQADEHRATAEEAARTTCRLHQCEIAAATKAREAR